MRTLRTLLATVIFAFSSLMMQAQPMSYHAIRDNARFLTDRMAYTLGLAANLIDDLYCINYDYIYGVNEYLDDVALGYCYDEYEAVLYARELALRRLLTAAQWRRLLEYDYFYRPIGFSAGRWSFSIYAYDRYRTRFYYSVPRYYNDYRGGRFFAGMHPGAGYRDRGPGYGGHAGRGFHIGEPGRNNFHGDGGHMGGATQGGQHGGSVSDGHVNGTYRGSGSNSNAQRDNRRGGNGGGNASGNTTINVSQQNYSHSDRSSGNMGGGSANVGNNSGNYRGGGSAGNTHSSAASGNTGRSASGNSAGRTSSASRSSAGSTGSRPSSTRSTAGSSSGAGAGRSSAGSGVSRGGGRR